jgi:anti-sigma regulatory factor (Ser/Thr protein kinase)
MTAERNEPKDLRRWLIGAISRNEPHISAAAAGHFGISRQTVNREIRRMVTEGLIKVAGNTKARRFELPLIQQFAADFPVTPALQEDVIWRQHVALLVSDLPSNVQLICQHGFTEMLNNVVDHSESQATNVVALRSASRVSLVVGDKGVGIFNKIQKECSLEDPRHAILELSKGKLTTDPAKHTGEGIFFTSRIFDRFAILSGHLSLICTPEKGDWLLDSGDWQVKEETLNFKGTQIWMEIDAFSERTLKQVMDRFAGEDQDYTFSKTHVPVRLARYGVEQLISRSQAKRLLARVNRFKEVLLDFEGVETIGQAFADEIFRIFVREHPATNLFTIRTNSEVDAMIKHVQAGDVSQALLPGFESPVQTKDPNRKATEGKTETYQL